MGRVAAHTPEILSLHLIANGIVGEEVYIPLLTDMKFRQSKF